MQKFFILLIGFIFFISVSYTKATPSFSRLPTGDKLYENDRLVVSAPFPNPATTIVNFEYKIKDHTLKGSRITLSDVLGTQLMAQPLSLESQKITFHLHTLHPGVYYYTLYVEDKAVVTKKIIVNH